MRTLFRAAVALLGLFAIQAAIQAGKARRLEKARAHYRLTKDIELTIKTYNVTKEELTP